MRQIREDEDEPPVLRPVHPSRKESGPGRAAAAPQVDQGGAGSAQPEEEAGQLGRVPADPLPPVHDKPAEEPAQDAEEGGGRLAPRERKAEIAQAPSSAPLDETAELAMGSAIIEPLQPWQHHDTNRAAEAGRSH